MAGLASSTVGYSLVPAAYADEVEGGSQRAFARNLAFNGEFTAKAVRQGGPLIVAPGSRRCNRRISGFIPHQCDIRAGVQSSGPLFC